MWTGHKLMDAQFVFSSECVQVNKLDWLVFNTALFCVAFLGVEIGLAIAIGLSIAIILYKTAFPHTAVLGRLPQTSVYRYKCLWDKQNDSS